MIAVMNEMLELQLQQKTEMRSLTEQSPWDLILTRKSNLLSKEENIERGFR